MIEGPNEPTYIIVCMGCSTSVASKSIAAPVALAPREGEGPPTERPVAKHERPAPDDRPAEQILMDDDCAEARPGEAEPGKNASVDQNMSVCNQTSRIVFPAQKPKPPPLNSSIMGVPESMR